MGILPASTEEVLAIQPNAMQFILVLQVLYMWKPMLHMTFESVAMLSLALLVTLNCEASISGGDGKLCNELALELELR